MECSLLDGSDEQGDEVSNVLTSGKVSLRAEVRLECGNVGCSLFFVRQEVTRDLGDQLALVGEDRSPFFNGSQVILHALASVELLGDFEANEQDVEDTLSDVVPATGLEVTDRSHEVGLHRGSTSVASLKLCQVVLRSHSVD